ncbi:hypothetical protein V6N13_019217 [Hibiscus sabdariffa]
MESVGLREANVESPGHGGRRARKSMSGAADDSTTKFPISGKVPLEWLMHRSASPSPGHAQSVGVFVAPGRPTTRGFGLVDAQSRWLCATCLDNVTPNTGSPCVATVQLGGLSRPSNVRASARSMSQWVLLLRQPALPCPPKITDTTKKSSSSSPSPFHPHKNAKITDTTKKAAAVAPLLPPPQKVDPH